ncbi:MAG: SDR family NAD(P)-dependent oxidoreductase [Thermoguttaceae bacterium]|nr:SDR family NAD(P)-dependent oxidoreductase [Thermoguttaceae bacterium]
MVKVRPVAAITGASSGFGKIYADRLASLGYDLILVARREKLLREVAAKLTVKYDVNVEAIVADLSDLADVERVEKRLEETRELRWLINNAGFGGNQKFPDVRIDVETKMVQTHCIASMRLCRAALVPMRERDLKRGAGYIINVASIAGLLAGEGAADYCGTKAYLIAFSRCLQCDVKSFGVRVQALCPGFARTGFHDAETMRFSTLKTDVPGFLWQRAERVVDASLFAIRRPRLCEYGAPVIFIPTLRYKIAAIFGAAWIFAPLRILFSRARIR